MNTSPTPRARRISPLLAALYLLGGAVALELVWYTLVTMFGRKGADFLVIREAAEMLRAGELIYYVKRVEEDLFGPAFHLPPIAALLATPFTLIDKDAGLEVWRALSLAAHFGALALLLRTLGVPWRSPLTPAALGVWGFFWPARFTFIAGQWDAFFLFALAAALWADRRGRGVLAGAALALAGSVKPYPLLALGYFGTRRRWGAVIAGVLGTLLLFGVTYAVAGPRQTTTFLRQVLPHLGATTAYAENQSLSGFLARLIELDMRPVPTEAASVYLLGRLLFVFGLLLPLGLLALRAPRSEAGASLQYAAWVAAMPIGTPAAWMHYQELLLLPFFVLAAAWLSDAGARPGKLGWALYALGLVLVAFGDHYTVLGPLAGELWKSEARVDAAAQQLMARFNGPAVLLLSYKLYGALILWVLCLRTAWIASAWERLPIPWPPLLARQQAGRSLASRE